MSGVALPVGRLGNRALSPRTDPRINPRLLAALAAYGLDALVEPPPISRQDSAASVAASVGQSHADIEAFYAVLPNDLPGDERVDRRVMHTTETVCGVDRNAIALHIYRPADVAGPLSCVIYLHSGGMTYLTVDNKVHRRWCEDLAASGMVVVAVDFRGAYSPAGPIPFPAGLHDCASALHWIHAQRAELGITKIILHGESGGANLALATTLLAKRDGRLDSIAGVYAMVPYISGGYGWDDGHKLRELPSLLENDGYLINCQQMDLLIAMYDPSGANAENPLCWPYYATAADLSSLPPHVISVNELDPLRDEGIAYYRTLLRAGTPAVGRVNLGLTHIAESLFRQALPEVHWAAVAAIKAFAESV